MSEINKLHRLNEVVTLTGFKRSTIYALMNKGEFPKSVQLGARAVAWRASDLAEWINSKTPTA